MHTVITARSDKNPALLGKARANLKRWRSRFGAKPDQWWQEWDQLLRRPWPELAAFVTDPGAEATRLRQSTPFAGVLTALQRRKIYHAFRA
jgi:poly(3-hydroxyalkanoate) synthetase